MSRTRSIALISDFESNLSGVFNYCDKFFVAEVFKIGEEEQRRQVGSLNSQILNVVIRVNNTEGVLLSMQQQHLVINPRT